LATLAAVTSSWVGPMPPVVKTWSCLARQAFTASAMSGSPKRPRSIRLPMPARRWPSVGRALNRHGQPKARLRVTISKAWSCHGVQSVLGRSPRSASALRRGSPPANGLRPAAARRLLRPARNAAKMVV
jgi:hypothetical protein